MLGSSQAKVSSNVLRQVEQTDLIQYGLIPEFVGRFPVISSLQVRNTCPVRQGWHKVVNALVATKLSPPL